MRVVQISEFRGLEALRLAEVAQPKPGPGEISIEVTAVSLNFSDTLKLRNKYQVTPSLPYSPGAEVAGSIDGVGAGVTDFALGQRVVALIGGNGCREKIVTKASNAIAIPDGVSDEAASTLPVTYGTALHGLKDRGHLKPGETVAVLGAAGGAGLAAVEIAKLMGARVIAVASSEGKLALARRHGADDGINYEAEDLKTRLKALTAPQGMDVLYDMVGGDSAEPSLRAMAWDGRYLVVGFASGTIPHMPLNLVFLKGCAIVGVNYNYNRRDARGNDYSGYGLASYVYDRLGEDRFGADRKDIPAPHDRGRVLVRQKYSLPQDWELQFELSYLSDRNFLQEYYRDEFWAGKPQETLLYYASLPNATGAVAQRIRSAYRSSMVTEHNLDAHRREVDPYQAYMKDYVWGSNSTKASQGLMFLDLVLHGIDSSLDADARKAAERYLHYLHGVNPLQTVYLSTPSAPTRE